MHDTKPTYQELKPFYELLGQAIAKRLYRVAKAIHELIDKKMGEK
jgi:hypothetical protein